MRLNAQTDFSLRMMMYLASKRGASATIQEISTHLGLSQAHLMRVAAKLSSAGLVSSTRGRLGGLALARDPHLITVEEVVKSIEPDFHLVQCFDELHKSCSIEPACLLKGTLSSALKAFFAELRAVSLASLTDPNHSRLSEIFRLDELNAEQRAFIREHRPTAHSQGGNI